MKARSLFVAGAFCAATLLSSIVFAQAKDEKKPEPAKPAAAQPPAAKPADKPATPTAETKPASKPAAPAAGGAPSKDELYAMMAKMAEPNEFHGHLKQLVGKWAYVSKFRMGADQPWEESKGVADIEPIMGGRYFVQKIKGDDPKMGFEGMGIMGYDKTTKKYFSTWIDSWGTGLMTSTGTCDGSGKTFTYSGEYDDPMGGGKKKSKSIQKVLGSDKAVFEMYDTGPDGKEFMSLEVSYSKK